jgi:hypothetical protein
MWTYKQMYQTKATNVSNLVTTQATLNITKQQHKRITPSRCYHSLLHNLCWAPLRWTRLPPWCRTMSYHLIHPILILISIRLSTYGWRLYHTVVAPHQLVRHKSFLRKVNLDLVLSQKPIVLTNFAWALRYTMTTSKSFIQEMLDVLNPLWWVTTLLTESVVHHPSVFSHLLY